MFRTTQTRWSSHCFFCVKKLSCAVAIEDAGFEIRDQIMWIYGSGFPKSHNIENKLEMKTSVGVLH